MNTQTATFNITGMTCGHCVTAVTTELSAIDGVTDVNVNLEAGSATVSSAAPLDRATVAAAIEEAGFELAT